MHPFGQQHSYQCNCGGIQRHHSSHLCHHTYANTHTRAHTFTHMQAIHACGFSASERAVFGAFLEFRIRKHHHQQQRNLNKVMFVYACLRSLSNALKYMHPFACLKFQMAFKNRFDVTTNDNHNVFLR